MAKHTVSITRTTVESAEVSIEAADQKAADAEVERMLDEDELDPGDEETVVNGEQVEVCTHFEPWEVSPPPQTREERDADAALRDEARQKVLDAGIAYDECEVDADCSVSRADGGTWVQAWIYLPG